MFHPQWVHLPLALALLYPLIEAYALWARQPKVDALSWTALGLLLVCSFLAVVSGQWAMDEAMAAGVPRALLDGHAEWGDFFPWAVLLLLGARGTLTAKLGRPGRMGAFGLALALVLLALQTGKTGGALVFEHGVGVSPSGN